MRIYEILKIVLLICLLWKQVVRRHKEEWINKNKKGRENEVENLGLLIIEKSKGLIETMNTLNFFCIFLQTIKEKDIWGQKNKGKNVSPQNDCIAALVSFKTN